MKPRAVAAGILLAFACLFPVASVATADSPLDGLQSILGTATDGEVLKKTAIALCQSSDACALEVLLTTLEDPAFLLRLDANKEYDYWHNGSRLKQILAYVGRLSPDRANKALLRLGANMQFMASEYGERAFWAGCGEVRKPSKVLLDHVERTASGDILTFSSAVQVFANMRCPEACLRIEKHFQAAQRQDVTSEPGILSLWFTQILVFVRDDEAIVDMYERMLAKDIKHPAVREAVVTSLFCFEPPVSTVPNCSGIPEPLPPSRRLASTPALHKIASLLNLATSLDVPPRAKRTIGDGYEEITKILAFRRAGKPERIDQLIIDLDSEKYAVREKAMAELESFGDWAEPALRNVLATQPSLEMRLRVERLLQKLEPVDIGSDERLTPQRALASEALKQLFDRIQSAPKR